MYPRLPRLPIMIAARSVAVSLGIHYCVCSKNSTCRRPVDFVSLSDVAAVFVVVAKLKFISCGFRVAKHREYQWTLLGTVSLFLSSTDWSD